MTALSLLNLSLYIPTTATVIGCRSLGNNPHSPGLVRSPWVDHRGGTPRKQLCDRKGGSDACHLIHILSSYQLPQSDRRSSLLYKSVQHSLHLRNHHRGRTLTPEPYCHAHEQPIDPSRPRRVNYFAAAFHLIGRAATISCFVMADLDHKGESKSLGSQNTCRASVLEFTNTCYTLVH